MHASKEMTMNSPVQIVQALYGAFGRGDVPALLTMLSDDVEWIHRGNIGLAYMGFWVCS